MIRRPVDPLRIEAHLAASLRCLAHLQTMAEFPPDRFDDNKDFPTALLARALLRESIESMLAIGRHVLARRHGIAVTEYRDVAVQLTRLAPIPRDLHDDFVSLARLRNRLTHAYLAVDSRELHDIVTRRLPVLRRLLDALVTAAGLGPLGTDRGPGFAVGEPRARDIRSPTGKRHRAARRPIRKGGQQATGKPEKPSRSLPRRGKKAR